MSEAIRFADLIAHEIGGGWGEETATDASPDAAFVIRGTDIPRALVGDVSTVPYRFHKTSNLRSRALRPLDIVFEVSGGSKGQPVGRALLVSQRLLDTLGAPTMCASFCKLIRLDPQACDPRFVFRRLQLEYVTGGLHAFQVQSTGITNFRWKPFLDQFEIVLPPRSVQERVADVLEAIDDLIENNRRRVEVLEEMARAIYREWFVHFRYPGHEDIPLVDSPLGPIPDGWKVSTCGDELTALGGGTPSKKEPAYWDDGEIPWFTPSNLTKSGWRYAAPPEMCITAEGLARSSARLFPDGSVLMTSRATLGVLAIASFEATTNQGFIVIPPDERWSPGFIREWLDWHAEELASVATGATFKEITKGAFKRVPFLVPAQDVLDAHREATDPLESEVRILEEQARNLTSLRDLLLPKLVTGQIDVSRLDLDELVEVASA